MGSERTQDRDANGVQDLGLQRVSGQADVSVHDESGGRRLSLRSVLVHDRHLQNGSGKAEGCGICSKGLEGALETVKEDRARRGGDEVAPSGGADEKRATAHASSVGPSEKETNPVLWR